MKIVLSALALLFLVGCSGDKESQTTAQNAAATPLKEVAQPTEVKPAAVQTKETTAPQMSVSVKEEEETKPVVVAQKDGATLFKTCASCHGPDASKPALGKSQVIKGWSAQKIADALHGYKNKTYGGASKAMMQGQVSKLSDEDIRVVSEYISKL